MVKVTIKRTDDATKEKKWVCERIDDDMESDTNAKTVSTATLLVVDENSEDKIEANDDCYSTIASCLEIEMKEGDNEEPSCSNSMENTTNIYTTHCETFSHEIESIGTSGDDPVDLSGCSKRESPKNVKNISYKSSNEIHTSKSECMDYVYTKPFDACGISGTDKTIQTETACFPPRSMWLQNGLVAPNAHHVAPNSLPTVPNSLPTAPNSLPTAPNSFPTAPNSLPTAQHASPMAQHILSIAPNALPMTPNVPPMAIQMPMNYWNTCGMIMNGIRFPNYYFPMYHQGVFSTSSQPTHTEKSEISTQGNIPVHQKQEVQNPLKANNRHSNANSVDYDVCSQQSYPKVNQSYVLPMGPEGNSYTNKIKQVCTEKAGDNSVNKLPQIYKNNRKRSSKNCTQKGVGDTNKPEIPPKKKKAPVKVQNMENYCNVCRKKCKSQQGLTVHLSSNSHLKAMMEVTLQQSNLYLDSENKSFELTHLQVQPQPNEFQQFLNQNRDPVQAVAMASTNELGRNNVISTNAQNSLPDDLQNTLPNASKTNYNEVSTSQVRPQNLERECYSQNKTHKNEPVCHIDNLQRFCSNLNSPQLENLTMANPNYLDSKPPQSNWVLHKDSPLPIQQEDLTVVNSRNVHLEEEFRIFHCKVCSVFNTNIFQHLELHLYSDRNRTPLELIIPMNGGLVCKLCGFKTEISEIMSQHCVSQNHLNLVRYYNHVREGGIHRTKNLNFTKFSPIRIFCSACECIIESMITLKIHSISQDHHYNVSCCLYIASVSTAVKSCFCRLCNLRFLSKRDLLVHARSEYHKNNLRKVPYEASFHDPRNIFHIQELNTEKTEFPRVSEQNAGSKYLRKQPTHLEKKIDEESNLVQNTASVNSGSSSSTSLQSQSTSCYLCQQDFPNHADLKQHLYQSHGVTKTGAEWLISKIQKEEQKKDSEKSLQEKIPADGEAEKVKSSTFWLERSDVNGQNDGKESSESSRGVRPAQGVTTDDNSNGDRRDFYSSNAVSSLSQQFNKTEHTRSPKKPNTLDSDVSEGACLDLSSSQNFNEPERLRNPDLDQAKRKNTNSASKQQFIETECTQNPDKLDNPCPNPYRRNSMDLSSKQKIYEIDAIKKGDFQQKTDFDMRQKINEKEHIENPEKLENTSLSPNERTCIYASHNEKFKDTEDIQNLDSHQEQLINIDTAPNRHFKERKRLRNPDKLGDSLSNPEKKTCLDLSSDQKLYETEDIRNSDLPQGERVNTKSQHFKETEGKKNSDLCQKSIITDSSPKQQFYETKNIVLEESVSISEKKPNFNSSEEEKNTDNFSEYYGEGKLEIAMDDSPSDETEKLLCIEENVWVRKSGKRQDSNFSQGEKKDVKVSEPVKNNIDEIEMDDSSSDETKNIFVIEEIVPIDDQKLNSNSSQNETLYQYDTEPFEKSEEVELDYSFSDETKKIFVIEEIVPIADQTLNSSSSQDDTLYQYNSEPIENSEDKLGTDDSFSDERKYITPVEENVPIAEERLNFSSLGIKTASEYHLEPIENNEDEKGMDDFSSDPLSSADTGSLISLSALNTSIESIDSCGSDDVYERSKPKEKQVFVTGRTENNSSPDGQDAQNIKSISECERNQNHEKEVDNYINDIKTLLESKSETNNSEVILEHSVNDRMELTDLPQKTEVYAYDLSSPSTTDSQIQAKKNIEKIEISNVFSLDCIDIRSDTDDGDLDIYSDL